MKKVLIRCVWRSCRVIVAGKVVSLGVLQSETYRDAKEK